MSRRDFLENWATMDVDNMEEATEMYANTRKDRVWKSETETEKGA